jgi:nitrogen fixation protein NifU and related proteins
VYSERLLEHFRNPRNTGELAFPAVTVEVTNPACGDILRLAVRWLDGRVAEARFQVRGCTASIAAGSALTELIAGCTPGELASIRAGQVEEALGGLPSESRHAAALAVDAVKRVLEMSRALTPRV